MLSGYRAVDVRPWEDGSRGRAVTCEGPKVCTATTQFTGSAGTYTIDVRYFDPKGGVSRFELDVNGKKVDEWEADDNLPGVGITGTTSTRRRISSATLAPGDTITITGHPDDFDFAAFDYVEFIPSP
jgi:alpha-glucuronidase